MEQSLQEKQFGEKNPAGVEWAIEGIQQKRWNDRIKSKNGVLSDGSINIFHFCFVEFHCKHGEAKMGLKNQTHRKRRSDLVGSNMTSTDCSLLRTSSATNGLSRNYGDVLDIAKKSMASIDFHLQKG
jgi:hypothetical protein